MHLPRRHKELLLSLAQSIFPWFLSLLLGVLTALSGSYIAVNCDFLGDSRFGFCKGISLTDRNRCCGGSENVNFLTERCITPASSESGAVEWIPWKDFFEKEAGMGASTASLLSFLIYVVASMVFTGAAVFLVHEYAPTARGSGIPEAKAAVSGFDMPHSFSAWCLLIKALGLSLVVGAGLSLGKEGPLIHIGVCWAYILQRIIAHLELPGCMMPFHELACVGAAAGVSTAFGAPLGGVLFAAEELGSVRSLSRRTLLFAFMAACSASFTLKHLNLSGANKLTLFTMSMYTHNPRKEWVTWQMAFFLMLGVVGGLVGAVFIKLNIYCTKRRRRCQKNGRLWMFPEHWQALLFGGRTFSPRNLNVTEGVLIAFVTSIVNFPTTSLLRMASVEAIHALFETCPHSRARHFGLCDSQVSEMANLGLSTTLSLCLATVVRILQTSYTFGALLPSGLFIPSLFIGANWGRLSGNLLHLMVERRPKHARKVHIEPGMFAMVGAVATLTGFCRMTVSLVVIMFELTGELTYIVPFMCAVLSAKLVGDSMTPSIYDAHAKLNGYAPIEDQVDIRLDMIVADLSVPVPAEDRIDAEAPISLHVLQHLAKEKEDTRSRDGGVLLLVRQQASAAADRIAGVVEKERLRKWLAAREPGSTATMCSFTEELLDADSGLACVFNECPVDGDPGSPSPTNSLADASALPDMNLTRLSPHAPLLTAYCVFAQKPDLQYCICLDERHVDNLSVLSREQFETALEDRRFPLAHKPYHIAGSEGGSVGAAAVIGMLGPRWRGLLHRVGLCPPEVAPSQERRRIIGATQQGLEMAPASPTSPPT